MDLQDSRSRPLENKLAPRTAKDRSCHLRDTRPYAAITGEPDVAPSKKTSVSSIISFGSLATICVAALLVTTYWNWTSRDEANLATDELRAKLDAAEARWQRERRHLGAEVAVTAAELRKLKTELSQVSRANQPHPVTETVTVAKPATKKMKARLSLKPVALKQPIAFKEPVELKKPLLEPAALKEPLWLEEKEADEDEGAVNPVRMSETDDLAKQAKDTTGQEFNTMSI
jgi:hypothetical protein